MPNSQPLSAGFAEYFIDTRGNAVRGGLRGSQSTAQFAAFEARQAQALGMLHKPWAPLKLRASAQAVAVERAVLTDLGIVYLMA